MRFLLLLTTATSLHASTAATAASSSQPPLLYFLHGKIVEDLGPTGVSSRFGRYDYPGLLAAFRKAGFTVVSEQRARNTDPALYAAKVAADIEKRIASGTSPQSITVVGTSKGAVIAMLVSSRLRDARLRYVFIANCNEWLEQTYRPRFSGEVLSIFEASDEMAQSCRPIARRSPFLRRFKELRLTTGLGHGFIYRPVPAWTDPTVAWARR